MQDSTAYIGLDVHSRTCTVAWMNEEGTCRGPSTFRTSGENLRREISAVEADEKVLTLEEGPLSFWTARVLDGLVDRTVVYAVKVRGRCVQPFRAPVIGPFPDPSFPNRTYRSHGISALYGSSKA
jgi:hypothetical protein